MDVVEVAEASGEGNRDSIMNGRADALNDWWMANFRQTNIGSIGIAGR